MGARFSEGLILLRGSFVCFCLEICDGGIVWVLLDFVCFVGCFF